ncbi:MAG TPA: hypothetical protein PLJ78_11330 [Anaerolineae bacterium]|mgnify:CR=1 FL=1|nr:hypothetical protein [Anaerolineae bacterium]HQK14521.1 hypothetical protein [Anaerolineae bacterium]
MAMKIEIRKARLSDAETIANFVNSARPERLLTQLEVAERFGQVGFLLAEEGKRLVGLIGWRVENLVIGVTDFLIAPGIDRVALGRALVSAMEREGELLQAEAVILFLPARPSQALLNYWRELGYAQRAVTDLPRPWREATMEWNPSATEVVIRQIREDLVRRPI